MTLNRIFNLVGNRAALNRIEARSRRRIALLLPVLLSLSLIACRMPRHAPQFADLPERHELKLGHLIVRSDVTLSKDEPLFAELKSLRTEIESTLELPPTTRPVIVHLFANEDRYATYMQRTFPNLPPRRAFFVGSPAELTVYAFWGDNVEEDLRHEYTHGVLHASLKSVPLWLDEGLAEYFETQRSGDKHLHPTHSQRLALAVSNGWKPDLSRLEKIEDIALMQRADYQEAWAWVHYLMHDAPGGRELLVDYCATLRESSKPPSFAAQIRDYFPDSDQRLTSYITMVLRTE